MRTSAYIASSLDGFIARADGSLDWLPGADGNAAPDEDFGYQAFIDSVDALVMGRNTFSFVAGLANWPYSKPVFVLSKSFKTVPAHLRDQVKLSAKDAKGLYQTLERKGFKHLYIDGGQTIQSFLMAALLDELILTRIPILIGSGIPLFSDVAKDIRLEHQETRAFDNGFVQSRYKIIR